MEKESPRQELEPLQLGPELQLREPEIPLWEPKAREGENADFPRLQRLTPKEERVFPLQPSASLLATPNQQQPNRTSAKPVELITQQRNCPANPSSLPASA